MKSATSNGERASIARGHDEVALTQIGALSALQLGRLANAAVSAFDATQVGALTATQMRALTTTQLNALTTADVAELSTAQIAALSTTQARGLSTTRIADLLDTQVAALAATQLTALTSTSLNSFADTQIAALEQTYREAASRERELRGNFETQRNTVLNQNEAAINYRIIQQEIDTNKALLTSLLQRSRETEVILNRTPNNVHVADRALVPGSPSGPQRTKNVLIAFIASLLGGIGVAFSLNWLDDTIRASDDFEAHFGVPVIGMIPKANGTRLGSRLLPSRFRNNGSKRIGKYSYKMESFEKPLITEAFHQFRTSLLLSTAGGAPKTVLITSGQPFEGKTITSLNLAKSLAQLGGKVLLIDADLRCPKLHVVNDVKNSMGLSNVLTVKDLDQALIDQAIQKGVELNLDILPSGPRVPNPANLFGSVEMSALLERLGTIYSHVIIDSPPLLYFADSVILASSVDAVVLVARANFSSRDVLSRAKRKIQDVRANIVGIVINDLPVSSRDYYNNTYYRQLEAAETEASGSSVLHLE